MVALHTRTDAFDVQTTGSGSLMSLEKTTNYPNLRAAYAAETPDTHGQDRRLVNPKVAVLQDFFDSTTGEDKATFQVAEPLLGLASLQHGYFAEIFSLGSTDGGANTSRSLTRREGERAVTHRRCR